MTEQSEISIGWGAGQFFGAARVYSAVEERFF